MTELHCHILPGLDDGARNIDESLALLREEAEQGVKRIVFTPHFNESITVDDFVLRREKAFDRLKSALDGTDYSFDMRLGAEVLYTPELRNMNLAPLCFSGTSYMLIEFSVRHEPQFVNETLSYITSLGITPIIAHVERYPYVLDDLTMLYDWVCRGVCVQVNAGSLWRDDKLTRQILKLFEWDLAHVISTDAHSPDNRPVTMRWGLEVLEQALGTDFKNRIVENGDDIFDNVELDIFDPYCPKKVLGKWK